MTSTTTMHAQSHHRRTDQLLIGRTSVPSAVYFVTICEANRHPVLAKPEVAIAIRAALELCEARRDLELIAAITMPDHVHIVARLGARLSLPRVIGKTKAHTRAALNRTGARWQGNFYEHHVRADNPVEPYVRYLFLNPYRANLIAVDERWPHWWRWGEVQFEFERVVSDAGHCPREWLAEADPIGACDV